MNNLLKYIDERLADPTTQGSVGLLMVRKYVEDNMEDHHIQNLKAYAHDFDCTIEEAEKALRVQPTQKNDSNTLEALDCISRQAVIDDMKNMYQAAEKWGREAADDVIKARAESCMATLIEMKLRIEKLPSAETEIIRCKDCTYWEFPGHCVDFMTQDENGFCSWAERRTDE